MFLRVATVPGRGWYGIRRRATDVYEDYEAVERMLDERVLNDQTGHRSSETRREVYQEKEREEIRAKSARTRRRVRESAFGRKVEPPAGGEEDAQTSLDLPAEEAEKYSSCPTTYPSPGHRRDETGLERRAKPLFHNCLRRSGRPDSNRRPPEPHLVGGGGNPGRMV